MEHKKHISECSVTLREVDLSKFPELIGYTKEQIWRNSGPGGLYLVSRLAKKLSLQPGSLVLDLGCGYAESSLYLAEKYQAKVIAADLWQDPTENARRIASRGHTGSVIPLRLDASRPLPFAEAYFDAIVCINNLNFYGTDLAVIDQLARHLKPGGIFCSGGECLNEEFTPEQLANPPDVYNFDHWIWEHDFLTTHSPGWWADHMARSELLQVVSCQEVEDGRIFYEEQALLTDPQSRDFFGVETAQQERELELRQIEYGRAHRPYMTIYQLVARRMG